MADETLPWLLFPPAVDLANTVLVIPGGDVDLLENRTQLEAWIAAERGRIPGVEAASGQLGDVRDLRDAVRALLHARARGNRLPAGPRRTVNDISARAPVHISLTPGGEVAEDFAAADTYTRFEATVARSAIELAGSGGAGLSLCAAPSCGMLFLRDHPRQVWCTKACGNRARVARHADRQRRRRARQPSLKHAP